MHEATAAQCQSLFPEFQKPPCNQDFIYMQLSSITSAASYSQDGSIFSANARNVACCCRFVLDVLTVDYCRVSLLHLLLS